MAAAFNYAPDAQAALLRSSTGEIVGTTWSGTMCLWPRKPSQFAMVSGDGDDQVIARCHFCPGCREYDRRTLARRLQDKYGTMTIDLWLMIVPCARSLQPALSARVRRTRKFRVQGFYRMGADACAFLVLGAKPLPAAVRSLRGRRVQVHRIRRKRGLRAWALLTAGMLRERAEYGEWKNRFYHRGLPASTRDRAWTFSAAGGIAKRHRVTADDQLRAPAGWRRGPRAARGEILLIPPSEWKIPRLLVARGPKAGQNPLSGEMRAILDGVVDRLQAANSEHTVSRRRAGGAPSDSPVSVDGREQRPTALPGYPAIKFLDGWGYKGSLQVQDSPTSQIAGEIARWKARMEAIAKSRT